MHGTTTLSQADPPPARERRVVGRRAGDAVPPNGCAFGFRPTAAPSVAPFGKQVGMLEGGQPCPRL